jgi:anti-sigma B factor antagonist
MELSTVLFDDVVVVSVKGEVDAITAPELDAFLKDQLDQRKNMVVNFSRLDYISSAGLRVLLAVVKEARKCAGDLRLAKVKDNIEKVLNVSGFISILKIYPDVDAAVGSFAR